MSTSGPSGPSGISRFDTPQEDLVLSDREVELLEKLFSNVTRFPKPFKTWLEKYVALNIRTISPSVLAGNESPQAVTFNAGWGNLGGAHQEVEFWKDPFGIVHLQGSATKSGGTPAAGNTIFVLPVGYRPAATLQFAAATGATFAAGLVHVRSNGFVDWRAGNTTETDYTAFDGIAFRAA